MRNKRDHVNRARHHFEGNRLVIRSSTVQIVQFHFDFRLTVIEECVQGCEVEYDGTGSLCEGQLVSGVKEDSRWAFLLKWSRSISHSFRP